MHYVPLLKDDAPTPCLFGSSSSSNQLQSQCETKKPVVCVKEALKATLSLQSGTWLAEDIFSRAFPSFEIGSDPPQALRS